MLIHAFRLRPHYERSSDVIYNTVSSTKDSLESILGAMKEYAKISANFDKFIKDINVSKPSKDRQIQNIVLIVGESVQRNLMQIYGYYLPNTPNFALLQQQKPQNFFVFDNVISSQATTYESLSQVLSLANQDNTQKAWYEHLNLIDAMKLGGYKSINISNQERFSLFSKASTTIFGRCDELYYTSLSSYFENSKPDEAILPILDKVFQSHSDKSLFLSLHLMGNHAVYYNRYPQDFAHFQASDIQGKRGQKVIAEYSNALLYTDFVLNEVIKRFENSDSIIIYLSDHGEDVYDSGEEYVLHSDSKINRFIVEIPFIVYVSDEFRLKHPELYARIKEAVKKPFMSDDLMHALIDLAGFNIDGFEAQRSLFNAKFNENRKRFVGKKAEIDYDKELKNQPRAK